MRGGGGQPSAALIRSEVSQPSIWSNPICAIPDGLCDTPRRGSFGPFNAVFSIAKNQEEFVLNILQWNWSVKSTNVELTHTSYLSPIPPVGSVEKCPVAKFLISKNVEKSEISGRVGKFQISPHDRCEEICFVAIYAVLSPNIVYGRKTDKYEVWADILKETQS